MRRQRSLDAARAPRPLVEALRDALAAERDGLERVRAARDEVCSVLKATKAEPEVTFTALATALTPATGDVAATVQRRRRAGHALRCRWMECRRRNTM